MFLLDVFHWTDLLQPQWYVENGGVWVLLFVVFAEKGLLIGFFLPGDSLLFVAGIFAYKIPAEGGGTRPGLAYQFLDLVGLESLSSQWVDLFVLWGLISVCGILGNAV